MKINSEMSAELRGTKAAADQEQLKNLIPRERELVENLLEDLPSLSIDKAPDAGRLSVAFDN